MSEIVNRVAKSKLISVDLMDLFPKEEMAVYDLKENLFQGLILREKDFRDHVKEYDWEGYTNKYVAITCSADAIIPTWAYMLVASRVQPFARKVIFGDHRELNDHLLIESINGLDVDSYKDAKVVIKGCSDLDISEAPYLQLTNRLTPVVSSLMFGEPCSTVPIYKKPKA